MLYDLTLGNPPRPLLLAIGKFTLWGRPFAPVPAIGTGVKKHNLIRLAGVPALLLPHPVGLIVACVLALEVVVFSIVRTAEEVKRYWDTRRGR